MFYNRGTKNFWCYNNTKWIDTAIFSGWFQQGNTATDTSTDFIGTTDDGPLSFKLNNIKSGLPSPNGNVFWEQKADIVCGSNIACGAFALHGDTTKGN